MSFKLKRISSKVKQEVNKSISKIAHRDSSEEIRRLLRKTETKKWNVLITGGSGHLAYHLVLAIIEKTRSELRAQLPKKEVIDQMNFNEEWRLDAIENAYNMEIEAEIASRLKIVLIDLLEPSSELVAKSYIHFIRATFVDQHKMESALQDIETVYHLAAVGMTGHYAQDRVACLDVNSNGTMNLLSWARSAGVSRFIYSSSIGVIFTGAPLSNVKESNTTIPTDFYNFYCESKSSAEGIVVRASNDQMKTTVLRFNGIYGPGEKRVTERVLNFMISGLWLAICKPDGREALTQLSSVKNCVQGLLKAEFALRSSDAKHGQVYFIVDKDPVGTFSFWTPLNDALGKSRRMWVIHPRIIRGFAVVSQLLANFLHVDPIFTLLEVDLLLKDNTFNVDKARREIGYEPYPDARQEIIEDCERRKTELEQKGKQMQKFIWRLAFIFILYSIMISWINFPFIYSSIYLIYYFLSYFF